jgi:hypothetical protein
MGVGVWEKLNIRFVGVMGFFLGVGVMGVGVMGLNLRN